MSEEAKTEFNKKCATSVLSDECRIQYYILTKECIEYMENPNLTQPSEETSKSN